MVDKMKYLEQCADQTDSYVINHKQMAGVAIVMFLKQQIGDFDPDNQDQ